MWSRMSVSGMHVQSNQPEKQTQNTMDNSSDSEESDFMEDSDT